MNWKYHLHNACQPELTTEELLRSVVLPQQADGVSTARVLTDADIVCALNPMELVEWLNVAMKIQLLVNKEVPKC